MTCEDEQDIEEEAPDCLGSRLLVLRDVMAGYDTSHILDVRDPWFQSLLDEALGLLGLEVHAESSSPVMDGDVWSCKAILEVSWGGETERFVSSSRCGDRAACALLAGRAVFRSAGLMADPRPMDPDGGWVMDLPSRVRRRDV